MSRATLRLCSPFLVTDPTRKSTLKTAVRKAHETEMRTVMIRAFLGGLTPGSLRGYFQYVGMSCEAVAVHQRALQELSVEPVVWFVERSGHRGQ